jgi:hypothetical protein
VIKRVTGQLVAMGTLVCSSQATRCRKPCELLRSSLSRPLYPKLLSSSFWWVLVIAGRRTNQRSDFYTDL